MAKGGYSYPVAISRLGDGEGSREPQINRGIDWLLEQQGGGVVVLTPEKRGDGGAYLAELVAHPQVSHFTWRGFSARSLHGKRALVVEPDRKILNTLWDVGADALTVTEWNEQDSAEWIVDAHATILLPGEARVWKDVPAQVPVVSLPSDVAGILKHLADKAAGYDAGLKWNEEDKLKSDMMSRPYRWRDVTVEQVRTFCRSLGMRPDDVNTIAGYLQKRKQGKRFNVGTSYKGFQFN